MSKQEFLAELRTRLQGLPPEELEERLAFYEEMLEDRIEEGIEEAEAVAGIGSPEAVASQILAEIPLTRIVKERIRPRRALRVWEIVLLVLGFPVWFPVLLSLMVVLFSIVIVFWTVLAAFWAAALSVALSALCGFACAVLFAVRGNALTGLALLGAGLVLTGLSILFFLGCRAMTKGLAILTKKTILGVKRLFVGKGSSK